MAKKDKKNQLPGDGATPEQDRMSRYGVRRESKKVKKSRYPNSPYYSCSSFDLPFSYVRLFFIHK